MAVRPVTDTDTTAARMARARQWIAHQATGYLPPWDGLTPVEQEQAETEARHWIQAAVNAGVKIVPPGCAVVELPEPDDTDNEGDPLWDLGGNQVVIAYCDADGHPMIRLPDGEDAAPEWVELYAAVLAAGVRTSRELADAFAERMAATAAAVNELVDLGLVEIVEDGGADTGPRSCCTPDSLGNVGNCSVCGWISPPSSEVGEIRG